MRIARLCTILLVVGLLAQVPTTQAEGWSFPNLLPFGGKKTQKPAVTRPHPTKKTSPFRLPNIPGFGARTTTRRSTSRGPKQPSMLTRMNNSTKQFFSKTKDFVLPKKTSRTRPAKPYITRRPSPKPKGKGILPASWFRPMPSKSESKPKSPSEWLSLPRVR